MAHLDRIEFTRKSFARNRQTAEINLADMRYYAAKMLNYRHHRFSINFVRRILLYLPYLWEKRRMVSLLRETRWKVAFYRKVEIDLASGDLGSAIEALSLFAPREETTAGTIGRAQTNPATLWAIQRSPRILRFNMLRLRDELIQIQQEGIY